MIETCSAAVLVDHAETWARAKELANYFEEDLNWEENECLTIQGIEDIKWVQVKQLTSQ